MKKINKIIGTSIFSLTVFIICSTFADNLIQIMQNQAGLNFVAQAPSDGFFTYLKVALILTFTILFPIIIYYMIEYIRPALYMNERIKLNQILKLTKISVMLFITGTIFGTIMIFKVILPYLTKFNEFVGYQTLYNANEMIMFIIMSIFYTGIIFQIPIINYHLLHFNILKIENIKMIRVITILGALIIGSIITPPDVLSQVIFSLPIWLLFEISTLIWRYKNDRINRNTSNSRSVRSNSFTR